MNKFPLSLLLVVMLIRTDAQQLINPLEFSMQLSGGFGNLRANHFHAGIDLRTKSSEGHAVHAVLDGYISRVTVGPAGFGLAIYVIHPADSLMTVYGHLQQFNPEIAATVKAKQYENERFAVSMTFQPEDFPVKQGDIIGFSGNSGSSGGPHLHIEVRDIRTNEWIDPLNFYKSHIPDTQKPMVYGLKIYPIVGKGTVNGSRKKQNIKFALDKNEKPVITDTIEAWGETGIGIRAADRMNGTDFSYGIKEILMTVDSMEVFRSHLDRFLPEEARYINSFTDYDEWSENRTFYIKTFVDPGNKARFITHHNYGIINILEERMYNIIITLTDYYGNSNIIPLKITGKKQDITPPPDTDDATYLRWYEKNTFEAKGIRMTTPRNSLYNSAYMRYHTISNAKYNAPVHTLHPTPVPLHSPARLSLLVDSVITTGNAKKYGIIKLTSSGVRAAWIGGVYRDGWMEADISELGIYTVTRDINPPNINPIRPHEWVTKKKISIRISDAMSGISSSRGEIDDKYALVEYDAKNALLTYIFDDERLHPGEHRFKLTVTDRCGNQSEYVYTFTR